VFEVKLLAAIFSLKNLMCFRMLLYRGADKSLARPGRKQATATEDFDFLILFIIIIGGMLLLYIYIYIKQD
jgi:hypothetical protein